MTETPTIAADRVAVIHYTLKDDDTGEVIESSFGGQPLPYLHGHANIVPGLEAALEGRKAGDFLSDVTVPPEQAYGLPSGTPPVRIHRRELPKGQDWAVGSRLVVEGEDGQPHAVWVTRAEGAGVWFTSDHPMAGRTLRFDVEVIEVRDATAVELEHGHAHGPEGHTHH